MDVGRAFHRLRFARLALGSAPPVASALGPCGAVWKKAQDGTVSRERGKRKAISAAFGGFKAFKGRVWAGGTSMQVRR